MKVLIIDQFSDLGGAQHCLLDLLPAIRARGWQTCVMLPGNGPLTAAVRDAGFETVPIACGPYACGRKRIADAGRFAVDCAQAARQIRNAAHRFSADVIYVNGPRALAAAAISRRPIVFHSHSFLGPGMARALCGFALRGSGARVITVCRAVAEPWIPFVGADRVRVIYNGVPGPARPAARHRTAGPLIGCIGRIAPEKGQMEFITAAALIRRAAPDCRFIVYGAPVLADPSYERAVRAAAGSLPVQFRGWTSNVSGALAELDLLLTPSGPHEANPRVILEAFAAGVPVVAFASGGIPEVIEHGRTGFLASGAEEMAQLAVCALRDHGRLSAVAAAARESWRRNFTLERWRTEVADYLEAAVRNRAACASHCNTAIPWREDLDAT